MTVAAAAAFSGTAKAATQICSNQTGTNAGYYYQMWSAGTGSACITLNSGNSYSTNWSGIGDFVAGVGWNPGNTSAKSFTASLNASGGTSLVSLYGWSTNPLVEYYVTENYVGSPNTAGTYMGQVTSDGGTFNIYEHQQVNQPCITGNSCTFEQYLAYRTSPVSSGTITFQNFVNAWASHGMNLGTMNYQIMATESYGGGSGNSSVTVNTGSGNGGTGGGGTGGGTGGGGTGGGTGGGGTGGGSCTATLSAGSSGSNWYNLNVSVTGSSTWTVTVNMVAPSVVYSTWDVNATWPSEYVMKATPNGSGNNWGFTVSPNGTWTWPTVSCSRGGGGGGGGGGGAPPPPAPGLPGRRLTGPVRDGSRADWVAIKQVIGSTTTTKGSPVGIRTGQQYLDTLNSRRAEIYVNGEKVTSRIADHPAFRSSARSYAHLFDMQHDAAHSGALTYASPLTGDPVSASFLLPRCEADLVRRRQAFSAWTSFSHGFLGRSGDYMNSALTALAAAKTFFGKTDPAFGERIRGYYEHARENDLLATHTLVPPQVNRAVSASQQGGGQLTAHVVAEQADGVVIRGARLLATLGPIADELLVFPSTVLRGTADDGPYSFAFAIPNDTPGLRYYCRVPLHNGGSAFDEPLASRFEEMDAVAVFDDVFVPHERIFMLGHPGLCNAWYSETGAGALMAHQVVTRTLAKTEFYLGLASEIAATIGIEQFQHIQEDLGELIAYVEIEKALLRAAEADGEVSEDGVFLPRWATLNAARNWYPRKVSQRLPEIIRKFSASGLMALPSEADFDRASAAGNSDLDTYLQAATATARQRARLFKLALDASVSGFAGRESLYEYYFFGDPVRMASAMVSGYDRGPARDRVRDLLGDAPQ